jgi:hypothetical protein
MSLCSHPKSFSKKHQLAIIVVRKLLNLMTKCQRARAKARERRERDTHAHTNTPKKSNTPHIKQKTHNKSGRVGSQVSFDTRRVSSGYQRKARIFVVFGFIIEYSK